MLRELVLLYFLSLNGDDPIPMTTAITNTSTKLYSQECDLRCFIPMVSVFLSLKDKLITGDLVLSELRDVCPTYQIYKQCTETVIDVCDPNIQRTNQFLTDIFQFVCDEAGEDIDAHYSCWTRKEPLTDMQTCAAQAFVHLSTQGQRCRFFEDFESCTFYRIGQLCGEEAAVLMANFLNRSNTQSKVDARCIKRPLHIAPTHRKKLPIQCYDCHNSPGSGRVNCPASGTITDWWAAQISCYGRCFARSPGWNRAVIYRGCTAGFWLPGPLPRSGCWTLNGNSRDVWCLCDTELCNTMDMRDILEETIN